MKNKILSGIPPDQTGRREILKTLISQTDREHPVSYSWISYKLRNQTGSVISEAVLEHYFREFIEEGLEIHKVAPNEELCEPRYYSIKMQPAAATTDCGTTGENSKE